MTEKAHEWDARTYEDVSTVQARWGTALLDLHPWRGDETVVDAGCGPGTLSEDILRRVPDGRVIAIDVDASMIEAARRRLAPYGDRAKVIRADLMAPPPVTDADLVFSNAVIHWIKDHRRLFQVFHGMLKTRGRLLVQGGGRGNLERSRRVADEIAASNHFSAAFGQWRRPWNYADVDQTVHALVAAGFDGPDLTLTAAPVTFPDEASYRSFLEAVILRPYLARIAAGDRPDFTRAFLDATPERTLDYVRLTVRASA